MKSFLTGSHVYGTPTPESDVDVVVLMSESEMYKLSNLADQVSKFDEYGEGRSLRFGKLNLIVLNTEPMFNLWRSSTDECIAQKPVDKKRAAEIFQQREESYVEANA
jgi:predicted nucleotidyltransferase